MVTKHVMLILKCGCLFCKSNSTNNKRHGNLQLNWFKRGFHKTLFFSIKVDILSQNNFIQLDQRNDAASKIMKKFSWKIGRDQALASISHDDNLKKSILFTIRHEIGGRIGGQNWPRPSWKNCKMGEYDKYWRRQGDTSLFGPYLYLFVFLILRLFVYLPSSSAF